MNFPSATAKMPLFTASREPQAYAAQERTSGEIFGCAAVSAARNVYGCALGAGVAPVGGCMLTGGARSPCGLPLVDGGGPGTLRSLNCSAMPGREGVEVDDSLRV